MFVLGTNIHKTVAASQAIKRDLRQIVPIKKKKSELSSLRGRFARRRGL
jgi:hypothetical protein